VAAMADIYEDSGKDIFAHNPGLLNKLTAALNECNEYSDAHGGTGVCRRQGPHVNPFLSPFCASPNQVGPDLHSGLARQVLAAVEPRGRVDLRAREPAPYPRQRVRCPVSCQGAVPSLRRRRR